MNTDLFSRSPGAQRLPMPDAQIDYSQHFVDAERAANLFAQLKNETSWRAVEIFVWGKKVMQPRLVAWYGDAGATYKYSGARFEPLPWTITLSRMTEELEVEVKSKFNSVLLNLYRDENDSMGWHSDDEPELGPRPTIASVSLGEAREFLFRHKFRKDLKQVRLLLDSGSLLTMSGDTQKFWAHSIQKKSAKLGARINLTFRFVHSR